MPRRIRSRCRTRLILMVPPRAPNPSEAFILGFCRRSWERGSGILAYYGALKFADSGAAEQLMRQARRHSAMEKALLSACSSGISLVPSASPLYKLANLPLSAAGGARELLLPVAVSSAAPMRPRKARIPRVARSEAQDALCDYLHNTRSLHFTDAEHMSKNSPTFLRNLIANLEGKQEVGRSLTRFLRYHPINEFEPFLESLGLKPSELPQLLPRNFFFLSDDCAMLENFHVLCNYGVPRGKIGKIYKEAREIFGYGRGVLASKLSAYEALGLSIPTVIKLVACCPSLLIGDVHRDFLQVLGRLEDAGIGHDWIRRCLSEENTYRWDRKLKMLEFLDQMGCDEGDLERLIREHPRFLFDDSGKKIYVLVAMLLKLGAGESNVLRLFSRYPQILDGSGVKNLWQSMNFLLTIGMESGRIASILCDHPQVLGSSPPKKPDSVLSNLEMGCEELCEMITEDPRRVSNLVAEPKAGLPAASGGNHLHEKTIFLLKLGFVENSDEMVVAMRKFRGRGDQLQERFDCLVGAGLDCHDVASIVKEAPSMLNQRTAVLKGKIDYLVRELGYPVESLLTFPTYLCYSPRRIKLRFSMYTWLKERGMAKQILSLSTILAGSNDRFLNYFVNLHPDGPEKWESLKKAISLS